jgi:hypothetical protein
LHAIADPKWGGCCLGCKLRERRGGEHEGRDAAKKSCLVHFNEGLIFWASRTFELGLAFSSSSPAECGYMTKKIRS